MKELPIITGIVIAIGITYGLVSNFYFLQNEIIATIILFGVLIVSVGFTNKIMERIKFKKTVRNEIETDIHKQA